MKEIEVRKNGCYQILLAAGDAIDVAILDAMAIRVEANPASIRMTYKDGIATITVEMK